MATTGPFLIDLAARESRTEEVEIGDDFFAALDQSEILGGRLDVRLTVRPRAGLQQVGIVLAGTVRTLCDRCLAPVEIAVEATGEIAIGYEGDEAGDDDTIRVSARETTRDIAWEVYETAALALPAMRHHAEGECDPEVAGYISE